MEKPTRATVSTTLILAVLLAVLMPFANAAENGFLVLSMGEEIIGSYFENGKLKQEMVDSINEQLENVPKELNELFGNNKINIYITLDDKTITEYYLVTKNGVLQEVFKGTKNYADIEVRTDESTIDSVLLSKDPMEKLLESLRKGKIIHKGLTMEGTVKSTAMQATTTIIDVINGLFGFFGNLFS